MFSGLTLMKDMASITMTTSMSRDAHNRKLGAAWL